MARIAPRSVPLILVSFAAFFLAPCKKAAEGASLVEAGVAELRLKEPASTERLLARLGRPAATDDGMIHLAFSSAAGDQTMDLVIHPGDVADSVSEVTLANSTAGAPAQVSSGEGFVTSRGVRLGMRRVEAERILGRPTSIEGEGGRVVLRYLCKDPQLCPSLKEYNLPAYQAELVVENDTVASYSFGYPYP